MTSDQEESDFDFLDEITQETLSRFFTKVTYNFINHTNKFVGGFKIRAADIKKFSDDEWKQFYQSHYGNFKLICTEYFKNEFVFVEKKTGKTKKEFSIALKGFLLDFFSEESDENDEVVADEEVMEEGEGLIQKELDPPAFDISDLQINDSQQSLEGKKLTNFLSDMLDSLRRHDALPDSDRSEEEPRVAGHVENLDKDFSSRVTDFPSQFSADLPSNPADKDLTNPGSPEDKTHGSDEIDSNFEQISQEFVESKEVVADSKIMEEGWSLIQKELVQIGDAEKAEDQINEKLENEQEPLETETIMDCQTCQLGLKESCELGLKENIEPELRNHPTFEVFKLDDPQQSSESQEITGHLSDMLDSLKRPDTLLDSDGDQEERIVSDYVLSLDEKFQKVSSTAKEWSRPSATEFPVNLSDIEVTKLKPLADSLDEPDEVDPTFTEQLREQNEAFMEKMAEKKRKREEKQKKFQEELNEIRKQQKLCFAALITCIQLKQRFEEKEQDVASWINTCCKEPVLRLLRGFEDFRDTAREVKYFKKIPEDSVADARSEIEGLHGKVYFLLDTLRTSFDQLEQLSGMAPDALFLRVLQKSICDLADLLNGILDILEETQIDNCWYLKLEESFCRIRPEKIPTTTMLKRICQNESGVEYENLKFPERIVTSSVVIVQEDNGEEPSEQRQEQESMESDNSFTNHLSTQNSVHTCFQEDQKTEEFDSFPTDNLEHQTKDTSTPKSNRKRSSDPAFLNSSLSLTPTNDFQKESLRTEKKPKHFHINLLN
ncbi:unnamed protein product [Caenorhabditis brenneri]